MRGAAAGAAGTTALNALTYLDMAVRGRPSSSTPESTVEKVADVLHTGIPGDEESRQNRLHGLGPLTGLATGVVVGAGYGAVDAWGRRPPTPVGALVVGLGAMVVANGPMAVLGVTDPRSWDVTAWLSDVVPHVAYGLVTAYTYAAMAN